MLFLLFLGLVGHLGYLGEPGRMPSFEEVRQNYNSSESIIYDRHNKLIHEYRVKMNTRQLEWTPIELVSPSMKEATVLSEDKRFWTHAGVDWRAALFALVKNTTGTNGRKRGASTITMQLASILDQQLARRNKRGRTVNQKLGQLWAALEIESSWTKKQILEAYLNLISFRGELRGIRAASFGLFEKAPHGLDIDESLILAALIRAPSAEISEVKRRACGLADEFLRKNSQNTHHGAYQDTCQGIATLLSQSQLRLMRIHSPVALAPHITKYFSEKAGHSIGYSTLDAGLQSFVLETLRHQILSLRSKNAYDAAALVLENATGEVLAYVGGVDDLSSAAYVDGVRSPRQAGSTLKPFLYGLAFDSRYLTAASLIDDSPVEIPVLGGVYRPRNYGNEFYGLVNVRTALASSLNVPAVKTLELVGVRPFVELLTVLGFQNLREADYYGPSLALGAADITLWDLVNAYRTLANRGIWSESHIRLGEGNTPSKRVFSAEAVFLLSSILSDREARSLTFGLENPLAQRFWTAVKTGTSKDMRDNYCIGYSDKYTVGVWVGNFSGEAMWDVTGITGAAPAWAEIMKELHSDNRVHEIKPPVGIVSVGNEWYLRGTEPIESRALKSRTELSSESLQKFEQKFGSANRPKITYPAEGMVLALDPDIPPSQQVVRFEARPKSAKPNWVLEELFGDEAERNIDRNIRHNTWRIKKPGRYRLFLKDDNDEVVDAVTFSVRGNVAAD